MKNYTYADVAKLALRMRNKYPQLRRGQSLMNALFEIDPDLYLDITGLEADCFYLDERIDLFKSFVENR